MSEALKIKLHDLELELKETRSLLRIEEEKTAKKRKNIKGSYKWIDGEIIEDFENLFDDGGYVYNMSGAVVMISTPENDLKITFEVDSIKMTPQDDHRMKLFCVKDEALMRSLDIIQSKMETVETIKIVGYPYDIYSFDFQKKWSVVVLNIFVKFFRDYCEIDSKDIKIQSVIDGDLYTF
jgi:hypothetical protein